MTPRSVPQKLVDAGISVVHVFEPGDLGKLIEIHGIQNFQDYSFSPVHEAYCAQIAIDFILNPDAGRSKAWLAKKDGIVVGSVLICELPDDVAQLRLLFADKSVRGSGLGRWLTEDSVRYCREAGFKKVFLWTVDGLERAISIYTSLGFKLTDEKTQLVWGRESRELRFDLVLTQ
ncbi:MAG: GNAT family N-acetyltransferase [Verrucomicrobia bacterium]|nr:GNAT family N-acetyltransferase [Verrucomicrobiota bacterium]